MKIYADHGRIETRKRTVVKVVQRLINRHKKFDVIKIYSKNRKLKRS